MGVWTANVWLNVTSGDVAGVDTNLARDMFVSLPETEGFVVESPTAADALKRMFDIGNRQGSDLAGRRWVGGVRSLSVGDVVELRSDDGVTLHVCCSSGWASVVNDRIHLVRGAQDPAIARGLAVLFKAAHNLGTEAAL